jgi:hypothetical protein
VLWRKYSAFATCASRRGLGFRVCLSLRSLRQITFESSARFGPLGLLGRCSSVRLGSLTDTAFEVGLYAGGFNIALRIGLRFESFVPQQPGLPRVEGVAYRLDLGGCMSEPDRPPLLPSSFSRLRTLHHCDSSHRTYDLNSPPPLFFWSIASISAPPRSLGLLPVEYRVSERDSNVHRDRETCAYTYMRRVRI